MSDLNQKLEIHSYGFEGMCFKHEGQDPTLLNCDFTFPAGEVVHIKSPEGAGKSTLLQILAGLLIPSSGNYLINGVDVVQMSFEEFLPYRLKIGFTFDYGGLINNRTIFDNLMLPLVYHKLITYEEAKIRVDDVIERFDLVKFRNERPAHVPGRVRKLAVLLRALVVHPEMLLLDDPSVGLGEATQKTFADYVLELREHGFCKHVIVSSYDDKFMNLFPHEVIHLDGGLIYHQPNEGLKKAASL